VDRVLGVLELLPTQPPLDRVLGVLEVPPNYDKSVMLILFSFSFDQILIIKKKISHLTIPLQIIAIKKIYFFNFPFLYNLM